MPPSVATHTIMSRFSHICSLRHLHSIVFINVTNFASGFRSMAKTPVGRAREWRGVPLRVHSLVGRAGTGPDIGVRVPLFGACSAAWRERRPGQPRAYWKLPSSNGGPSEDELRTCIKMRPHWHDERPGRRPALAPSRGRLGNSARVILMTAY
jgi:hypothetical protein